MASTRSAEGKPGASRRLGGAGGLDAGQGGGGGGDGGSGGGLDASLRVVVMLLRSEGHLGSVRETTSSDRVVPLWQTYSGDVCCLPKSMSRNGDSKSVG